MTDDRWSGLYIDHEESCGWKKRVRFDMAGPTDHGRMFTSRTLPAPIRTRVPQRDTGVPRMVFIDLHDVLPC